MPAVLVIEDDELNREMMQNVLGFLGYDVAVARNVDSGLALARELHPVLILMDLRLGDSVDGLQGARLIKADPQLAGIPVILTTVHHMPGDEYRAYEAGCDGYIAKPIDLKQLRNMVQDLAGGSN